MEKVAILIALLMSLAVFGCSQEETAAPQQGSAPAPAEKSEVAKQAEQAVDQVKETAAQVAEKTKAAANEVVEQGKAALASGESVYSQACVSCHKMGIAGAPKTGDKEAWKPLLDKGIDQLTHNANSGIGKMPAKGGRSSLADAEVRAAVEYMVEQSK